MTQPKPSLPPANLPLVTQKGKTEGKPLQVPLAHSLSYIQTIFEKSPVGMLTCKATGEIVSANPALAQLSGGTIEQIEHQNFRNLTTWQESGMLSAVDDAFTSGVEKSFEGHTVTYFGKEIWVSCLLTPFLYEGEQYVLVMLTDTTRSKQAEDALHESEERLRRLAQVTFEGIVIHDGRKVIDANPAAIALFGYEPSEVIGEKVLKFVAPESQELIIKSLQTQEEKPIEANGLRKDGTTFPLEIIGKTFSHSESTLRVTALRDISEHKQAEAYLKRQLKELAVLHEVAGAAAKSAGVDELIENITQVIGESLYPDNCGVLLFDTAANVLRPHPSYRGVSEAESLKISIPLGEGVTGRVAFSRQPARIANVQSLNYYIKVNEVMHSELCVPILAGELLLGVINAESAKSDAFSESDETLMITIAGTLATAIEKLHLFEETSRRLEHVQALHKIDTAISNSLDLGLTINIFLEEVMQQLGVHATDILILQPYTLTLEYLSGRGFKTKALQHTQLRLGQGYAGLAGQERKTIHISNLRTHKTDFLRSPDFKFEEFESYYGVPLIAKGQLKGVLEVFQRGPLEGDREWLDFLEILAGQAAIAIDNVTLFNDLQRTNSDLRMAYDATIEGWSRALDLRDEVTEGHTQRVVELTMKLAQEMGINETEQVHVLRGTLLHDIGKLGVPDNILRKTGPLTAEEWGIMRKHPMLAYEMLTPISYLRQALDIPFCHHEKWDGNGYPRGLKGEQIPLAARIFSVVDVWDALISDRPYRKAWAREEALAYIRDQAGKHFDPQVVDIFLREIDTVNG